jgi:hypothetical protein
MSQQELLKKVIEALEEVGIQYMLTGSWKLRNSGSV